MKKKFLIVGGDGGLGAALRFCMKVQEKDVVVTSRRTNAGAEVLHLDLAQPMSMWPELSGFTAAIICAAETSLEKCRLSSSSTRLINVDHTVALATRLVEQGAFVVFPSTNLVFDGSQPFCVASAPGCPQTEYGRQKAAAEAELASLGSRCAVMRLTKVFHLQLPLVQKWLQKLGQAEPLEAFDDLTCAPISLLETTRILARVATEELSGIWQLSAPADVSYALIAKQLAAHQGQDPNLVHPCSCKGILPGENIPQHTTLDASRAKKELGFQSLSLDEVINQMFAYEKVNRATPLS